MYRAKVLIAILLSTTTLIGVSGCGGSNGIDISFNETKKTKDPKKMSASELQQYLSTKASLAVAEKSAELVKVKKLKSKNEEVVAKIADQTQPAEKSATDITGTISNKIAEQAERISASVKSPTISPERAFRVEKIRGMKPAETEKEARDLAMMIAAVEINRKLQNLDPPLSTTVSSNRVTNEFLVKNSGKLVNLTTDEKSVHKLSADSNPVWYEVDVEVSQEQIREIRAEERFKLIGPLTLIALTGLGVSGFLIQKTARK